MRTSAGAWDVMVGGVPGAGKTTAIAEAARGIDGVIVVDPSQIRRRLRRALPALPYRSYRWLVHAVHTARVLAHLMGPRVVGRRLVIHDPGTRTRRRALFRSVARLRRRRFIEVYIDPTHAEAVEGQRRRGRIVRSFEEHWRAWQAIRPRVAVGSPPGEGGSGSAVILVSRAEAAATIRQLLAS